MSKDIHPFPSALWIVFSAVLSIVISSVLMIILFLPCNALAAVGKSVAGVFLVTLVPVVSIYIGAAVAYRLTLRKSQPENYKVVKFGIGIPLFILGVTASFLFPALVDAVLKKTSWGVGAIIVLVLSLAGTALTHRAILFAYRRQSKKVIIE